MHALCARRRSVFDAGYFFQSEVSGVFGSDIFDALRLTGVI